MKKVFTFYSCSTFVEIKKYLSEYFCSRDILIVCGDKKFRDDGGCRKLKITIEEVGK